MRATSSRISITAASIAAALIMVLISAIGALAGELRGSVSVGADLFMNAPAYAGQTRHAGFVAVAPEYRHEWSGGKSSVTISPYLLIDSSDTERTHFDMRELYYLRVFDSFELGVGARRVFWGTTESQHLVDIVNQTDLVASVDGEEKLGAPMVSISVPIGGSVLDIYVLPYFRERTFPGRSGRLRTEPRVDTGAAEYESGAGRYNIDLAVRWLSTIGDWDAAISIFHGAGREPTLISGTTADGEAVLIPRYVQIDQAGVEVLKVSGDWLWKLEAIARSGQGDNFAAWTGGFERTFYGVFGTAADIGLLAEWSHDTRGAGSALMEDDLMAGIRLTLGDLGGTETLLGIVQDLDTSERSLFVESSRRLTDHLRVALELRVFSAAEGGSPLTAFDHDDFIRVEAAYHF